MGPLYTLLLCLPAVLVFIACVGGLAALRPPVAQPAEPHRDARRYGGRASAQAVKTQV